MLRAIVKRKKNNHRYAYRAAYHESGPVEKATQTFWFVVFVDVYINNLTRRNKYKRSILVIVSMTTIFYVAALHIFKINSIKTEVHFGSRSQELSPKNLLYSLTGVGFPGDKIYHARLLYLSSIRFPLLIHLKMIQI